MSSLDELARQSKINYSVLQSTATFQYFENMGAAEEELYRYTHGPAEGSRCSVDSLLITVFFKT